MRLLFISSIFPNPVEPTKGTFNCDLVRALASDHEVDVISPVSWATEFRAAAARREELRRCRRRTDDRGVTVHHPRYYYPPRVLRSAYGTFYWHSIRATLSRVVRARRPDAVIGYWAHPDGGAAVRLAEQLGVPSAVIVGGSDVLVVTESRRRRRCVARVLCSTDAVVTLSRDLKSKVVELGVEPRRVHLWRRGVDECFVPGNRVESRRRIGIDSSAKTVLWVGRLVPVKGLETLMEACQIARERGEHFRVYLVGDGPLRQRLQADRDARGLREVVSFTGPLNHGQLPDWYRAADLTVLPSWSEGLPNVLRESLACGTPFVASRVGGIPEIAGRANRLFPPGDAAALAEAIRQSLNESSIHASNGVPEPPRVTSCADSAAALVDLLRPLVRGRVSGRVPTAECEGVMT